MSSRTPSLERGLVVQSTVCFWNLMLGNCMHASFMIAAISAHL
ncbi:hypothetical protein M3J09_012723 [Ascochyta lentis]